MPARALATMYTCPQLLREALRGHEHEEMLLAVADVWALAVILYFLLFGRWPFAKSQICHWPLLPAQDWRDDADVSYELDPGAPPGPRAVVCRSHNHSVLLDVEACAPDFDGYACM